MQLLAIMHFLFTLFLYIPIVVAAPVKRTKISTPSAALMASFKATSSIDPKAIYAAAQSAKGDSLATYAAEPGQPVDVHVYGDWLKLSGVSALHFIADMDVDCDGADFQCAGNPDGQAETNFGHLDASKVPFYVIPQSLADKQKVKPNALGAVICNNNIYYGIFGDANGDSPQVIGEASLLMAQTCFPDENISGNNGHGPKDVLYIVFPDEAPSGVGDKTIDIGTLQTLGNQQMQKLQQALNLDGSSDKHTSPSSTTSSKHSATPTKTAANRKASAASGKCPASKRR